MHGVLRKKQLIFSFVKHFTENDSSILQFHNQKLSQKGCFKPYVYYMSLCTGRSMKELIPSFLEYFTENHEKAISVCFQFYISN